MYKYLKHHQRTNEPTNQRTSEPTKQPSNQADKQTSNQATKQTSKQATNQIIKQANQTNQPNKPNQPNQPNQPAKKNLISIRITTKKTRTRTPRTSLCQWSLQPSELRVWASLQVMAAQPPTLPTMPFTAGLCWALQGLKMSWVVWVSGLVRTWN